MEKTMTKHFPAFWAQFTNPTCWWKSDIGGFTKKNFTQNIMVLDLNSSI
jgi:hypothetical protein